MKAAIWYFL